MTKQWTKRARTGVIFGLVACAAGCGGEDDSQVERAVEAAELAAAAAQTAAQAAQTAAQAAQSAADRTPAVNAPVTGAVNPPVGPVTGTGTVVAPLLPGSNRCTTPSGVSGAPETLPDVIALLNALPRPLTLPCFIESLERPLSLYFTSSQRSLQPAPEPRSPRTFVLRGAMEFSVVLGGDARYTLEVGYRPSPLRSIKTEFRFPIYDEVTPENYFDEIEMGKTTRCAACHTGEVVADFDGFPDGVYESDVFDPFSLNDVSLDTMVSEAALCKIDVEPDRCALLQALFNGGEVQAGQLGDPSL
jgi:hypothetical protein